MIEDTLNHLAERILNLDEASLTGLCEKYKIRMDQFDTSRDWEKSVIIFFLINAVRAKNQIFNDHILKMHGKPAPEAKKSKSKPDLKLVK